MAKSAKAETKRMREDTRRARIWHLQMAELPEMVEEPGYARWLVEKFGDKARRALIRAEHRYDRRMPRRDALRRMHAAYRRKTRR